VVAQNPLIIYVLLCLGVSQLKSEVGQTDPQTTFTPVIMEAGSASGRVFKFGRAFKPFKFGYSRIFIVSIYTDYHADVQFVGI